MAYEKRYFFSEKRIPFYQWIIKCLLHLLGRYEESKKIILMISEKNGTNVSEEMIANMFKTTNEEMKKEMNKSNLGVLDLFRYK